jgi:hypothetical protein
VIGSELDAASGARSTARNCLNRLSKHYKSFRSQPNNTEETAMSQDEHTTTTDVTSYLTTLNEDILQAEEAGQPDQIAPHLHEDFTIIRAKGARQNRAEFLKAVPANANRGRTADEIEVRSYGDSAVFVCRVSISRNADGTPASGHFWNTRVFVRQDGEWRCVAWQVTEIQ